PELDLREVSDVLERHDGALAHLDAHGETRARLRGEGRASPRPHGQGEREGRRDGPPSEVQFRAPHPGQGGDYIRFGAMNPPRMRAFGVGSGALLFLSRLPRATLLDHGEGD